MTTRSHRMPPPLPATAAVAAAAALAAVAAAAPPSAPVDPADVTEGPVPPERPLPDAPPVTAAPSTFERPGSVTVEVPSPDHLATLDEAGAQQLTQRLEANLRASGVDASVHFVPSDPQHPAFGRETALAVRRQAIGDATNAMRAIQAHRERDRAAALPATASYAPQRVMDTEHVFRYHAPTDEQLEAYEALRAVAKLAAETILAYVPGGADQSTALTKVREFVMWANAGVALEGRR